MARKYPKHTKYFSHRLAVTFPLDLYHQIKHDAKHNHISFSKAVVYGLKGAHGMSETQIHKLYGSNMKVLSAFHDICILLRINGYLLDKDLHKNGHNTKITSKVSHDLKQTQKFIKKTQQNRKGDK